ncbi:lasso RiPP family leader peptide-containing protein [Amycolatopsis sp. VS8301801F10]
MRTLPERYQAPKAVAAGRFATDTRQLGRGALDSRWRGRLLYRSGRTFAR